MIYEELPKGKKKTMSEIRFSIETTYRGDGDTFVTRRYTFGDTWDDFESDQIERDPLPVSILSEVENPLSSLGALFWFNEMMATRSLERRLLERVLRTSRVENELRRDNTKRVAIALRKYQKEGEKEHSCTICSDKFVADEEVAILSCDHIFHQHCIEEWGHYKAECPLCKKSIPLVKENLDKDKDGMEESNKTME